jgi:hypothetical protein
MRTLSTTCPRCDQVLHPPADALLVTRSPDGGAQLWLLCTGCDELVGRTVSDDVRTALLWSGAHALVAPAVPRHPEERPEGPDLGADDVLALHEALQDDDAVAAALRALLSTPPA